MTETTEMCIRDRSLMGLPIEQYPNIVPPTIKMQATYPGANAETVANSVALSLIHI